MKSFLRPWRGVFGTTILFAAGCAQPAANNSFTVQQIDAGSRRDGAVRIKLTTPGDLAEADEGMIVDYVKIVAVHAATIRQRQVAQERARATFRKIKTANRTGQRPARYLAVATDESKVHVGQPATKSVMIWDTRTEEIVGNNVYDIAEAPRIGRVARFEIYSAEYVGSGL